MKVSFRMNKCVYYYLKLSYIIRYLSQILSSFFIYLIEIYDLFITFLPVVKFLSLSHVISLVGSLIDKIYDMLALFIWIIMKKKVPNKSIRKCKLILSSILALKNKAYIKALDLL